jgi:hypothetical protein
MVRFSIVHGMIYSALQDNLWVVASLLRAWECDDRRAKGAGRFGLEEHPAPISGKMAVCTNDRHFQREGERDAAQD